jgi:hypothetical protein
MTRSVVKMTAVVGHAAPGSGPAVLGPIDPWTGYGSITVVDGAESSAAEGTVGVVIICPQQPILYFVLHTVSLVGGLDVHKGHGSSLATTSSSSSVFILFVTEKFDALDTAEPIKK